MVVDSKPVPGVLEGAEVGGGVVVGPVVVVVDVVVVSPAAWSLACRARVPGPGGAPTQAQVQPRGQELPPKP